ncbi:MAG: restriction endonuclease subunit S, partial [Bacteroidales bacterium]|nr:restriction endonuclease subunit S [Bacteroidales bacterium]
PSFFPFLFHSKQFIDMAITISVGGLSPTINWKDISKQEFLLPPKSEQKRLAELLWVADEMIEKEKKELEILKDQIQVYINDNCNIIGKPKIPFSNLVNVNPTTRITEKEVSLITMTDISEEGELLNQEKVVVSDYKSKGLTPFQENDILFAKITPCMENGKGSIARGLYNGKGLGSTEFHVLRPKVATDLYFCYYLTMSKRFRKLAERQMTGSAGQKRVQADFFEFHKICALSPEERKNIGEKLYEMDCCTTNIKNIIAQSQQLKQELINKVF